MQLLNVVMQEELILYLRNKIELRGALLEGHGSTINYYSLIAMEAAITRGQIRSQDYIEDVNLLRSFIKMVTGGTA
jgi:hypothetical protein